MAKKKTVPSGDPAESPHAGGSVVKFFVNPEAHAKIQLAAAMSGRSMAAFCRDLVMEIAEDMTANIARIDKTESIVTAARKKLR